MSCMEEQIEFCFFSLNMAETDMLLLPLFEKHLKYAELGLRPFLKVTTSDNTTTYRHLVSCDSLK